MAIDHSCLTDEIEYFDPLNDSQKERARRTVAANAIDAHDAAQLMMALGIHPSQKDDIDAPRLAVPTLPSGGKGFR